MPDQAAVSPLEILRIRQAEGYRPGVDDDGHTVAIACDGGGMAGVVGLGMAEVASDEGMFSVADKVVGLSVGSLIGAAALTDQLAATKHIMTDELPRRHFIDNKRLLHRRPIVDLGLLESIITDEQAIDTDRLAASPTEFVFGVTDITHYDPVAISSRSISSSEITGWLLRGIHLPRIARSPTPDENGTRWADGGISWLMTQDLALQSGATEVVNLTNEPKRIWENNAGFTTFIGKWLRKYGHPEGLERFRDFSRRQIQRLNGQLLDCVQVIRPEQGLDLPGVLCTNTRTLHNGYLAGQRAMAEALRAKTDSYKTPHRAHPKTLISSIGDRALQLGFSIIP